MRQRNLCCLHSLNCGLHIHMHIFAHAHLLISDPPQYTLVHHVPCQSTPIFLNPTCHGHAPGAAIVPPTIRLLFPIPQVIGIIFPFSPAPCPPPYCSEFHSDSSWKSILSVLLTVRPLSVGGNSTTKHHRHN